MKFFSKKTNKPEVVKKIEPVIKTAPMPEPVFNVSFFPGYLGSTTGSGVTVTETTSLQLSAVYSCVNMISTDIANLKLSLQKKDNGGWKNCESKINKVLQFPCKRDTMFSMLRKVALNYLVSGNGYIVLIRNHDGTVKNMISLDSSSVNVHEQINGDRLYYVTSKLIKEGSLRSDDSGQKIFREEDVVHIQNISLYNDVMGKSPMALSPEIFGLGLAAQETAARSFNNGSYFTGYLKCTGNLPAKKIDEVQEQWNRSQQSITSAGRTPVVPHDVDYINIGASPVDLQLIETREQLTKDVARMFKVPLHKLGYNDSEKASNIEEQERNYIASAIKPITENLVQELNKKVLFEDQYDTYRFNFDFTDMIMPDQIDRGQYYSMALTNGWMNRDEVRENEGYSPLPDGQGKIFLTPTYTAQQDGTGSHNIEGETPKE